MYSDSRDNSDNPDCSESSESNESNGSSESSDNSDRSDGSNSFDSSNSCDQKNIKKKYVCKIYFSQKQKNNFTKRKFLKLKKKSLKKLFHQISLSPKKAFRQK